MPSCYPVDCTPDIPVPTPTPLPPCTDGEECAEVVDAACVVYTDVPLPAVNVLPNDRLDAIIKKWALAVQGQTQAIATLPTSDITFTGSGHGSLPLKAFVQLNPDSHNLISKTNEGLLTVVNLCLLQDLATLVTSNAEAHELFCEMVAGCASGHCGTAVNLELEFTGSVIQATWIPFPINSSSQVVQFKKPQQNDWTSLSEIHFSQASEELTQIYPNCVYQVRIQTNCYIGGPSFNIPVYITTAICPLPQVTPSYDSLAYTCTYHVHDYTRLIFTLTEINGTVIGTKSYEYPAESVQVINDSFANLDPGTAYQLIVTMRTPVGDFYTKVCPALSLQTSAPPSCALPSNLQALIL